MYYLQSRYYDPSTGRFINADGYITTGQGVLSYNMFAYCLNNPVMMVDPSGEASIDRLHEIFEQVKKTLKKITVRIKSYIETTYKGDYDDFLEALRNRESSGRYDAINQYGYMGAYQLGSLALQDAGFLTSDGDWTALANSYGVYSQDDFLNNPQAQDAAVLLYHKKIRGYISALGLDSYVGTTYQGVVVTESGLLATCHLIGAWDMKKALSSNTVITDGNGTEASEYMALFGGYYVMGACG